jgi:hypothetical protein
MWRDPIEEQIELALRPGAFMHDRACSSFVGGLEGVAAQIDELQKTDAVRAAGLYEAYLADWEDAVRKVRAGHYRKTAFMGAFEPIAAGDGHREPPCFLERAKDHWGVGRGGGRK